MERIKSHSGCGGGGGSRLSVPEVGGGLPLVWLVVLVHLVWGRGQVWPSAEYLGRARGCGQRESGRAGLVWGRWEGARVWWWWGVLVWELEVVSSHLDRIRENKNV